MTGARCRSGSPAARIEVVHFHPAVPAVGAPTDHLNAHVVGEIELPCVQRSGPRVFEEQAGLDVHLLIATERDGRGRVVDNLKGHDFGHLRVASVITHVVLERELRTTHRCHVGGRRHHLDRNSLGKLAIGTGTACVTSINEDTTRGKVASIPSDERHGPCSAVQDARSNQYGNTGSGDDDDMEPEFG